MERQTINQLTDEVLDELKKQGYATKNGEKFLTDNLVERYMLDIFRWDINIDEKLTENIEHPQMINKDRLLS